MVRISGVQIGPGRHCWPGCLSRRASRRDWQKVGDCRLCRRWGGERRRVTGAGGGAMSSPMIRCTISSRGLSYLRRGRAVLVLRRAPSHSRPLL